MRGTLAFAGASVHALCILGQRCDGDVGLVCCGRSRGFLPPVAGAFEPVGVGAGFDDVGVEGEPVDDVWADRFEALRSEYTGALSAAGVPVVAIEHVGSTSVPGLAAKPIIDCDIIVEEPHVEAASAVLISLGFTPLGELGIPQRWAFDEPDRLAGTNTYVIVEGSLALRNHLAVRGALRADPQLRDEYGEVKKCVGAEAVDIYAYGAGKNAMVQRILESAGLSEGDRAFIDANQVPVKR